jgi:xanthine dehydrogenase accessory factor
VEAGEIVAYVEEEPVRTAIAGVLRGILADGLEVVPGMKVGDVDPRAEVRHCFTVSDKAWAVGGGVLEAVLCLLRARGMLPWA